MAHALNGASSHHARARSRAAAVSIVSNTLLIALKVVAGVLTGSVAILTEALHSAIDLLASLIAFFSVRRAEEPADASHRYGHEKFENAAAAAEGMLILAGSAVIVFAAIRALINGPELEHLGVGIVVIGFASVANLAVCSWLFRRARETLAPGARGRRRPPAHRRLHVDRRARRPRAGQRHRRRVAGSGRRADHRRARSSSPASRITMGSLRVLVDEALPDDELNAIQDQIESFADRGVVGYHQLRTRRAGARRYVDLHVQFRRGTSLEEAHQHRARAAGRDPRARSTAPTC